MQVLFTIQLRMVILVKDVFEVSLMFIIINYSYKNIKISFEIKLFNFMLHAIIIP
jgi:hypothetical protein